MVDGGLLAAPGGLADVGPVGGLVAGAAMALGLDEGLEQDRRIAVALMPVEGQLAGDSGQDL